jgi:putative hydrolases of HD superfamily
MIRSRMRPNDTLLDTLLEMQVLDRVPRSGWTLRGVPDAESVAEHGFHVAFLVWALAGEVPDLDRGRAVELALVHDVAEVRFGDLPATAGHYLPAGAKHAAEVEAAGDLLAPLGSRATALYAEYDAKQSREARFVAACDKLQLMIKVARYESWGARGLAEFWDNPGNFPSDEFPPVRRVFDELRQRREAMAGRD